jgi:phosphohistidine phosphatase
VTQYLILMRHGDALPTSPGGDRTRELSEKGHGDIRAIASVLVEQSFRPSLLLHSPFTRTTQTADIVASAIGCEELKTVAQCFASGKPLEPMLYEIEGFSEESILMVVGHMPDVGELGAEFGNMSLGQQYAFVPGGFACIRFQDGIRRGQGEVLFMSRPSDLKQLPEKLALIS